MKSPHFFSSGQAQIAVLAAKLLRETGLELPAARAAAVQQLGLPARSPIPPLAAVLAEAQTQLRLFEPEQAEALLGLRQLALRWMQNLAEFAPLLGGNVWLGLANRHSSVYLDLYAESSKEVEIFLINQGVDYETPDSGEREDQPLLRCHDVAPLLHQAVPIYLQVHDAGQRRGALKTRLEAGSEQRLRAEAASLLAIMQA